MRFENAVKRKKVNKNFGPSKRRKKYTANLCKGWDNVGGIEQKAKSLEELVGKIDNDEECDPSYMIETAMKLGQELDEFLS